MTVRPHSDTDDLRRPAAAPLFYSPSTTYQPAHDTADGTSASVQQQTDDDQGPAGIGLGQESKAGGGGRRKAGSGRLRFQYPDVFGRRRARGGVTTTAAGRRRTMSSAATAVVVGRINFRHHRPAPTMQRDEFTFTDPDDPSEVLTSIVLEVEKREHFCAPPRPSVGRHKAVLRTVFSVCLSVMFSDSVPFARRRYARIADSNAFDKGQHVDCTRVKTPSAGGGISFRYLDDAVIICRHRVSVCQKLQWCSTKTAMYIL